MNGLVERACGHPACGGAHRGPQAVECGHAELEAAIELSEERLRRHATAVESELTQRVRRGQHLRPFEAKTACVRRHDERGDPAAARPGRRSREDHVHIGDPGVRDQMFLAVEYPRVAIARRGRRERRDIRAGVGLGHRKARHRSAVCDRRQPPIALRRCAREADRGAAQSLKRHDGVGQRAHRRDDLAHDAHRTKVLLGDPAQPSRRADRLQERTRVIARPPYRLRARDGRGDAPRSTP